MKSTLMLKKKKRIQEEKKKIQEHINTHMRTYTQTHTFVLVMQAEVKLTQLLSTDLKLCRQMPL